MLQVATTDCTVTIYAPSGTQFLFEAKEVATGLLSVETQKDMSQAVGSFTLTFDGRRDSEGRRWDERIPRRSLVFITMRRSVQGEGPERDPTVMIGLTDLHAVQESYSEAAPRRRVVLRGREIACVIVDVMLWYHAQLAANPRYGTLTTQSQDATGFRMSIVANPALIQGGLAPIQILRTILDLYLFRGGDAPPPDSGVAPTDMPLPQAPLLSIDLPGLPLAKLLVPQYDAWTTFDEVTVPAAHFPARVGSLWNYLHLFIDRNFQEFFTRIEGGECRIFFRGKPFLHDIVTTGTRFKSSGGPADREHEPTLDTLALDPADIVSQSVARDTSQVYNVFSVIPRGFTDGFQTPNLRHRIMPQVVDEPTHPSFVGRYGVRLLEAQSMYLSFVAPETPQGPTTPAAQPQALYRVPAGASQWADRANQIAQAHGIPADQRPWFVALIHQESSFNPNAVHQNSNGTRDEGIAQFHTPYPNGVTLTNPFDPEQSLNAAAQYWNIIRATPGIGNDPRLIVAAYNAGPGTVVAAKGVPPRAQQHVAGVTTHVPRYQGYAGTPAAPLPPTPAATQTPPPASGEIPASMLDVIKTAERWAAILRAWYDMGGEFFAGTITVRGDSRYTIGHRLLCSDAQGDWEAYIEGVQHAYDARTGHYLTTLRITRGWYLSASVTQQIWQEGQTKVERVTGGPPTLDPATGEPVSGPMQGPGFGDVEVIIHGEEP
jgi:hypothetical protein